MVISLMVRTREQRDDHGASGTVLVHLATHSCLPHPYRCLSRYNIEALRITSKFVAVRVVVASLTACSFGEIVPVLRKRGNPARPNPNASAFTASNSKS